MNVHVLERTQWLATDPATAWDFFSQPANLNAITPPDLGFHIVRGAGDPLHAGQIIEYRIRVAPLCHLSWLTVIPVVDPGRAFVDEQRAGPYRLWHHRHAFSPENGGVRMTDRIHYALPLGCLGSPVHRWFVRPKLEHIFAFRSRELCRRFPGSHEAEDPAAQRT